MAISPQREKVIDKLEEMLKFFRQAPIKNEDSLVNINKRLDDLMSSLKYVPIEPSFDSLPTEIKTAILNHLCDSGAFVAASVSQEWKNILQKNLTQVKEIRLGKHCSNRHECEDIKCFMPDKFLEAGITHKLDVPLLVCHPLLNIEPEIIVEGLTSLSNLSINVDCECEDYVHYVKRCDNLSYIFDDLFDELELKGKIMDSLEITGLNLFGIDQSDLVNYLLNKVKKLTLVEGQHGGGMLDSELFIKTLSQISADSHLQHLTLGIFDDSNSQTLDQGYPNWVLVLADAVCQVPSVNLRFLPSGQRKKTVRRLFRNIQTQNIRMKSFELDQDINWRSIFTPKELIKTLEKMDELKIVGNFTVEQVEAATSLPGVEANLHEISKCSI